MLLIYVFAINNICICFIKFFNKFYYFFRWIDRNILKGIISKSLDKLDDTFWGGWDDIHAMGFNKTEEDELVFAQMMMSPGVFIPFPYFHQIHDNKFLDREFKTVRFDQSP